MKSEYIGKFKFTKTMKFIINIIKIILLISSINANKTLILSNNFIRDSNFDMIAFLKSDFLKNEKYETELE